MTSTTVVVLDDQTQVLTDASVTEVATVDGDAVDVEPIVTEVVVSPTPTDVAVAAPTQIVELVTAGPQGPPGPPGNSAATLAYTHDQQVPLDTWTIDHNLGFIPGGVLVIDTLGEVVWGQVAHPSPNRTILTFSAAFSGVAYLS
jgi:hypothetical protein